MDPQEWQQLIAQHGGIAGHTPVYTKAEQDGVVDKNLHPPMSLVFKDGSTMEAIFEDDGSVSVTKPLKAGPKTAASVAPKIVNVGGRAYSENPDGTLTPQTDAAAPKIVNVDGRAYSVNPDGSLTPQTTGPPTVSIPDPQHPGQMIDVTPAQAQAYINQQKADQTSASAADRIDLSQQRVDLATQKQQYSQIQQAADNEYKRLQLQVQQGQLTNNQAIAEFDRFWKLNVDAPKAQLDAQNLLYNTGQSAGMDAAKLAQMGTEGMVGPGFGANFADALTGLATGDRSKVHFGANDFTYQIPDYGAIAKNAAAAAIAHLSPYAASIAGTAAPSGYQAPGQQPGVVAPQAIPPNPSPLQPPSYKPAGFVG